MTKNKLELGAVWLACVAGLADFPVGLVLVVKPEVVLGLLGMAVPGAEAQIFLRWVGAFVAAVGFSYLWALGRRDVSLLRHALELTISFRVATGLFTGWAVATGRLGAAWLSVTVVDLALAAAQTWLLRRGVFR